MAGDRKRPGASDGAVQPLEPVDDGVKGVGAEEVLVARIADPAGQGLNFIKAERGPGIVALSMNAEAARVAWADDEGQAGVTDIQV